MMPGGPGVELAGGPPADRCPASSSVGAKGVLTPLGPLPVPEATPAIPDTARARAWPRPPSLPAQARGGSCPVWPPRAPPEAACLA